MSNLIHGKLRITDEALKIWELSKGAEVLDIGCGQGETVEYLEKEYGYKTTGIDISKEIIQSGLERNPKLNIQHGDGEFLDGFLSYSFDGVMMGCILSLIGLPDEALHEAYCVLKKGGKLFISDLYIKDPGPEFMKAVEMEAERQKYMPHAEHEHNEERCDDHNEGQDCSDCDSCTEEEDKSQLEEEHRYRAVNFRSGGKFLLTPLVKQLQEIGFINIAWKDCTEALDQDLAKKMMKEGTLGKCRKNLDPVDKYETGYFMLTAEKPM